MKTIFALLLAFLAFVPEASAQINQLSQTDALNRTRSCTPAIGTATKVTTSTSVSAGSGQLNADSMYWLYCTTSTFVAFGTSAVSATSANFLLAPSLFPVMTDASTRYIGFKAASSAGSCYLLLCH